MVYCTPTEVREVSVQITATAQPTAWTDDVLNKIIERASRIFDRECGVEDGYFEAAGTDSSTKTIYGDGSNLLRLPPYVPGSLSATITVPTGYTAQEFIETGDPNTGNQYLAR